MVEENLARETSWMARRLVVAVASACAISCASAHDAARAAEYFKPQVSYLDGLDAFPGPARGYAPGGWTTFKPEGQDKWHGAKSFNSSLWELSRFSGGREQDGKRPSSERVGGTDMPLTDAMKADVRRFLEETRQNGGSLIVRIGYTWSDSQGCEPSDFDIVLGHVRDLSKIMSDYDDVIVGVEAGVAGPWGEMHSSDYCKAEYMNRVLKTYCDNLSPKTSILTRTAAYIAAYAGVNADGLLAMLPFQDRDLRRFGMYNDGYLGTWRDYGTWAGEWKREKGCMLLKALGDHPYGGELAYVSLDWLEGNRDNCGDLFDAAKWNIVKDWYDCHLCYLRNVGTQKHPLCKFIAGKTFVLGDFRFDGMPDLGEYDGQDMHKFMYDHMGYRFVVRDARLPKAFIRGKASLAAVEVENTGFGRLLLPSRVDVVFVGAGTTNVVGVSTERAGFSALAGAEKRRIPLKFTLPREMKSGTYDFYIRVSAPLKDEKPCDMPRRPVRFANVGMWDDGLKANGLGRVEVR